MRRKQTKRPVVEAILDEWPDYEFLKVDGFDDCIVGVATRFGMNPVLAYDRCKMIEKMVKEDKMTYLEAEEYFDYNIIGAWMGENTPLFIDYPSL